MQREMACWRAAYRAGWRAACWAAAASRWGHGIGGHAVRAGHTSQDRAGFMICGVIMLVGGLIGMALIRPERDALRWTNPTAVAAAGPA